MSQLVETIKISDGKLFNIEYHNNRMHNSMKKLFGIEKCNNLENNIIVPVKYRSGLVKCRILYSKNIESIIFEPYVTRIINSIKIVNNNTIDYTYKYSDRSTINRMLEDNKDYDDILIIKNGFVTDTSFSNIVFQDGEKLITPSTPLLKGTKRESLLLKKIISERNISIHDLKYFKKCFLINAMVDLYDVTVDIESLIL